MRRIRDRIMVAAILACASCVPASEEAPPAGALGFSTEPSPATRGEPFVSDDGWTVRVEKLVLQVSVSASSTNEGVGGRFYGSSERYRFDASQRVEVFARAVPAGIATGTISFSGSYASASDKDDGTTVLGISPEDSARFGVQPDLQPYASSYSRPSMLLVLRAEKAGRVIAIDLPVDGASFSSGTMQPAWPSREVRGDELVTVPLTVAIEALFEDENTNAVGFEDFAAADKDHDGSVSAFELASATVCDRRVYEEFGGLDCDHLDDPRIQLPRLLDRLRGRSGRILVPR